MPQKFIRHRDRTSLCGVEKDDYLRGYAASMMLSWIRVLPAIAPEPFLVTPESCLPYNQPTSVRESMNYQFPSHPCMVSDSPLMKVTLANGCQLAFEIYHTAASTTWLVFVWISNTGTKETLAMMRVNFQYGACDRHEVLNFKFDRKTGRMPQMIISATRWQKWQYTLTLHQMCSEMMDMISTRLLAGARFVAIENELRVVGPGDMDLLSICPSIRLIGDEALMEGLYNGFHRALVVTAVPRDGTQVYGVLAASTYHGAPRCDIDIARALAADQTRTADVHRVVRLAWVSVVVRVAVARVTVARPHV